MNLVKISEMLKNAPDRQLAAELNNPSGSVPSYLVLSELQRRKKIRGSLMNEEPQTSVAEDATQEATMGAAGGLGSMGMAPAQPAPQGFAGGGEVRGYYDGGDVGSFEDYQQVMGMTRPSFWGYSSDVENEKKRQQLMAQGMTRAQADAVIAGGVAQAPAVAPAASPAPAVAPVVKPPVAAPAGIPAATKAAPKSEYSVESLLQEARDIRRQQADAFKNQADIYKQQAEEVKNTKTADVATALMTAGFGIMGGRSQYAAENIGQGALPAVQQFAGQERARREQLQKLALGQGALGIEQLGAQMKGVTSEGELGLGERKVAAEERKARASEISAGASASYYKQMIAQAKSENDAAKLATSVITSGGFGTMSPEDQKFFLGIAKYGLEKRFPGAGGAATKGQLTGDPKSGYYYGPPR